eukprot:Stramenopile-MAST_4_protein_4360
MDIRDRKPRKAHVEAERVYAKTLTSNKVQVNAPGVGTWGGECTCPDGKKYFVGDNNNACRSLACVGGKSGKCIKKEGKWSRRKVMCAPREQAKEKKEYAQIRKSINAILATATTDMQHKFVARGATQVWKAEEKMDRTTAWKKKTDDRYLLARRNDWALYTKECQNAASRSCNKIRRKRMEKAKWKADNKHVQAERVYTKSLKKALRVLKALKKANQIKLKAKAEQTKKETVKHSIQKTLKKVKKAIGTQKPSNKVQVNARQLLILPAARKKWAKEMLAAAAALKTNTSEKVEACTRLQQTRISHCRKIKKPINRKRCRKRVYEVGAKSKKSFCWGENYESLRREEINAKLGHLEAEWFYGKLALTSNKQAKEEKKENAQIKKSINAILATATTDMQHKFVARGGGQVLVAEEKMVTATAWKKKTDDRYLKEKKKKKGGSAERVYTKSLKKALRVLKALKEQERGTLAAEQTTNKGIAVAKGVMKYVKAEKKENAQIKKTKSLKKALKETVKHSIQKTLKKVKKAIGTQKTVKKAQKALTHAKQITRKAAEQKNTIKKLKEELTKAEQKLKAKAEQTKKELVKQLKEEREKRKTAEQKEKEVAKALKAKAEQTKKELVKQLKEEREKRKTAEQKEKEVAKALKAKAEQ